jgi:hypothetical protein
LSAELQAHAEAEPHPPSLTPDQYELIITTVAALIVGEQ